MLSPHHLSPDDGDVVAVPGVRAVCPGSRNSMAAMLATRVGLSSRATGRAGSALEAGMRTMEHPSSPAHSRSPATQLAVALLTFAWVELWLNFTFHRFTDGDLGIGLALPSNFHLLAPAGFVSWAMFFAAGAAALAARKSLLASAIGATGGFLFMALAPQVACLPDFWGIAAVTGTISFTVAAASSLGDWYFAPGSSAASPPSSSGGSPPAWTSGPRTAAVPATTSRH